MKAGSIISRIALLFVVAGIMGACNSTTHDERARAYEAERQQILAASRQALAEFAGRYGAAPVKIVDPDPLVQPPFTAQRQQQLEGRVVAFRARVLDVVRLSSGAYEIVLVDDILGGTVIRLKAGEQHANQVLTRPREALATVLVVAEIHEVVPLTLKVGPCHEQDCEGIRFETDEMGTPLRISGEAIEIEAEP